MSLSPGLVDHPCNNTYAGVWITSFRIVDSRTINPT